MDPALIDAIMSWPGTYCIAILAVASSINIRFRLDVEQALGWPSRDAVRLPEKQWNYEAEGLRNFVRDTRRAQSDSLDKYMKVLQRSDILFAIALAGTTAYLWYWIATIVPPPSLQWAYPYLAWLAPPLGAMALIYGVSDVAEDLKLTQILRDGDRIDPAEAAAANMLTRIKIASLCASVIGIGLFVPIGWAYDISAMVRKRLEPPLVPPPPPPGTA